MSRRNIKTSFAYTGHTRGPFLTNKFGRYFTHLNKFIKSAYPPGSNVQVSNSISSRPSRRLSPALSSISSTPRLSLTTRSGSSSALNRSNISLSSMTLEKKKIHMRNRSDSLKSGYLR